MVWPDKVAELIACGVIETDRADARFYGRLAARFPMGLSRIDWSQVPGTKAVHRTVVMRVGSEGKAVFQSEVLPCDSKYGRTVTEFLDHVIEAAGFKSDEIVVLLGDGTDTALWLSLAVLREHIVSLVETPQYYYILPPDAGWCFNYTFEDDLYFGYAVWQEGRKPRDRRSAK